ncbi:MAG: ATP-dependent helicase [Synechococcus sp. SB0672_bin_10]|nr:ATP-dependent helicase [Synechococcus sp. SB0672_bin_10]
MRRNPCPPERGEGQRHVLDNRTGTVVAYLREALASGEDFSVVSAYFTIHGYGLLADHLEGVGRTRFLFGDPGSVEDLDPGQKEPKAFELTEGGLEPRYVLAQKALARRCAAWVRQSTVEIRSVSRANFLHGKMYLTVSPHGATGVVGSSNFTRRGLGAGDQPNLEINLATEDQETVDELRAWFDRLWADDGYTRDVKQQVLDALAHMGNDYAPEAVYYKTLYELFRQEIAARQAGDDSATTMGLKDSQVWNKLYQFQQDGARSVIAKLVDHNGCILADSVGLGKTYTALAVIKYFELRNQQVLVLCPRKLCDNWSFYPASNGHPQNPFPQDRFGYTLLAHTDLSRDSGRSGNVDLAHFQWGNYDLVVIDESHNFRNDGSGRYQHLLEKVIRAGGQTKVLLLSATPVNTSLMDLRNQIYLMTEGREQAFQDSLGVGSIRALMARAQKEFKQWEQQQSQDKRRDKAQLLDSLGADFLRLLNGVSISRSRRQIEQFYADEMERIGRFPRRAQPVNVYPHTDINEELSYQDLGERIGAFMLAVYQPSAYVIDPGRLDELESKRQAHNFNQKDSERFLVGMMRVNLLKRLESSAHALQLTMERTIKKIDNLLKKIERYEQGDKSRTHGLIHGETLPDDDNEDEEFAVNRSRHPYRLAELDLPRWTKDLKEDRAMLSTVRERVAAVTPERDGKLQDLKQRIRRKAGQPNRKLLVFTTFKDTAKYLYDNLQSLTKKLGIAMAMVSGDETHATAGPNNFNAVLSNFAPTARQRPTTDANRDIDLLIATDCISEGQNLQDCDTVLNYDIHWNPVRLVQRFGRIDRIGSRSPSVRMVHYWPTEDMETYLRLQNRVQARMALADLTASGDEDPFSEEDMARDLRFRDAQLLQLREEVPHLEDLDDAPVLADFTLDDFLTQLLRYLERNRAALEAMPSGVYAVTEDATQKAPKAQPGVIFCLRQRNANPDKQPRTASPLHPHYLVHVQGNGAVRYGCGSARNILMAFEAAAAGQTRPITRLCRRFDQETQNGRRMGHYEALLSACIAQIRQAHHRQQTAGLGRSGDAGFKLLRAAETPRGAGDFELVTWLVIQEAT